jgi:mono/diheme cytochrome c family protein
MTTVMTTSIRTKSSANMRTLTARWRRFRDCLAIAAVLLPTTTGAQTSSAPPSSAPSGQDASIYAELVKAPPKATARRNPLASDPDAVAAGSKLFAQHCAECHGDMADGGKKGPSLLAPEVHEATPGTLFWLLTNGVVRRGMPVWSKLPEPQRWQLVSFIKALTPATPNSEKAPQP